MKIYLHFIFFAAFALFTAFAEECEPNTVVNGHAWLQGQDGTLKITVPSKTYKWRVYITYDKPPKTISAWQGKGEKCKKKKRTCSFQSENHNKKQKAGDVLQLGYQIQFDQDPEPPKVTSVVFKYCDTKPCGKWKRNGKKYVVCPSEEPTEGSTESSTEGPTEAPTNAPTEGPTEVPTETPTGGSTEGPTEGPTEAPTGEPTEAPTDAPTEIPDGGECIGGTHIMESAWNTGSKGKLSIPVLENTNDWKITLTFDKTVKSMDAHQGRDESCDGTICTFTNENWNGNQQLGNMLELTYQIQYDNTNLFDMDIIIRQTVYGHPV